MDHQSYSLYAEDRASTPTTAIYYRYYPTGRKADSDFTGLLKIEAKHVCQQIMQCCVVYAVSTQCWLSFYGWCLCMIMQRRILHSQIIKTNKSVVHICVSTKADFMALTIHWFRRLVSDISCVHCKTTFNKSLIIYCVLRLTQHPILGGKGHR